MATCQKKIQTGTAVVECGRHARWLCLLQSTFNALEGRTQPHIEYRCEQQREGEAQRVRGAA